MFVVQNGKVMTMYVIKIKLSWEDYFSRMNVVSVATVVKMYVAIYVVQ
jgi:hypothetical protein